MLMVERRNTLMGLNSVVSLCSVSVLKTLIFFHDWNVILAILIDNIQMPTTCIIKKTPNNTCIIMKPNIIL